MKRLPQPIKLCTKCVIFRGRLNIIHSEKLEIVQVKPLLRWTVVGFVFVDSPLQHFFVFEDFIIVLIIWIILVINLFFYPNRFNELSSLNYNKKPSWIAINWSANIKVYNIINIQSLNTFKTLGITILYRRDWTTINVISHSLNGTPNIQLGVRHLVQHSYPFVCQTKNLLYRTILPVFLTLSTIIYE